MNQSSYGSTTLLTQALRAGAEALLAVLDGGDRPPASSVVTAPSPVGEPIAYDPLTDPVPLPCDPKGSEPQQLMAWLTYLGAIARTNASEGRGATSDEVTEYALKAGYMDGRAVNSWARGEGGSVVNLDGARFLKPSAHEWLPKMAAKLGIELKGDYTPLPIPQQ